MRKIMASVKWTDEQQAAIDKKGSNILVAAAAGSGKTAVLVERIIKKIIVDRVDIDKILVVTFTNAAASEMRERILEAIYKKIEENPEDANLQKQIILLNKSSICTIDSFCLDVIRNNFYEIDISANARVADSTEMLLLKQEVLDDMFEDKYISGDKDFLDLIDTYTKYNKDEDLKEICSVDNIITIVDCLKFHMYMNNFRRFYIDQIKYANIIVLSRVQLADKNTVNYVQEEIKKINPNAQILDCIWDEVNLKDKIVNKNHTVQNTSKNKITMKNIKVGSGKISTKKVNDSFQSFTLKLNRKISSEELSSKFKFIASSKSFGTILRAKGIVQLLNGQYGQFDFSLNEYNIEKIDYNDENIISFIGVDINKKELEHFFK